MYPVFPPTWGRLPRLTGPPWWIWSLTATPSCWLTGPGGRPGRTRSSCPAATATDGRRPRLRNWRPASTAMTLVAAWYRSMDGGHVVFCANDSAPNLDYLRDAEAAGGTPQAAAPARRSPRIPGKRCSTPTCTPSTPNAARPRTTSRRRLRGIRSSQRVTGRSAAALGSDAVQVEPDSTRLAAGVGAAAQPWGGSYCSYQLGVDGPFWVMPALGPSMDEFNRRLARADGLKAEPDPKLGGAVNLVRPGLADAGAAPRGATGHSRAAGELRDLHRPARTERPVAGRGPGTRHAPREAPMLTRPGDKQTAVTATFLRRCRCAAQGVGSVGSARGQARCLAAGSSAARVRR